MSTARDTWISSLATLLGDERAREVVDGRLPDPKTDPGIASREAEHEEPIDAGKQAATAAPIVASSTTSAASRRKRPAAEREAASLEAATPATSARSEGFEKLVAMLAQSLGVEKSIALVEESMGLLGLRADRIGKAQALLILETLAMRAGVIGTVARFAKARAHFEIG